MKKLIASLALVVLAAPCLGLSAEAQREHKPITSGPASGTPVKRLDRLAQLKFNELKIMDNMVRLYGMADFSDLIAYIKKTPQGSPNNIVPILLLGHSYLNRYVELGEQENLSRALDLFEIAADPEIYGDAPSASAKSSRTSLSWGKVWASSPTAMALGMGIARLRTLKPGNVPLESRIGALDLRFEIIESTEADMRITDEYPYKPYVSGTPTDGDSKYEEDNWEAANFAWASQLYPNHPHAALWEAKARQLAKFSTARASDMLFFEGVQVVTILEDGTVWNHWAEGNPWYNNVILPKMGALAYRMHGKPVPPEFEANVALLHAKYKTYCVKGVDGRWTWNRFSDPVGDPTIFPIPGVGDDAFEQDIVHQKANDGWLWLPTEPITGKLVVDPEKGLTPGSSLGVAVQNGKVTWYYLTSYLWHFGPK